MPQQYEVRFTTNFVANLDTIHLFLADQDQESAFDGLLSWLFDELAPNLEAFPRIGRDFLARIPASLEGITHLEALKSRAGSTREIREYIADDYLVLYAIDQSTVSLLAIRHHRQLSFDLRGHWV